MIIQQLCVAGLTRGLCSEIEKRYNVQQRGSDQSEWNRSIEAERPTLSEPNAGDYFGSALP